MHAVCKLNGPIGGEESWCKGFAHPECDREDPASPTRSAPSLTQIQCLHLEHACTQRAPDVIGPYRCIMRSSFRPFKQTKNYQIWTNRRYGITCAR